MRYDKISKRVFSILLATAIATSGTPTTKVVASTSSKRVTTSSKTSSSSDSDKAVGNQSANNQSTSQTPPAKPDGNPPDGNPPDDKALGGQTSGNQMPPAKPDGNPPSGQAPDGASNTNIKYSAVKKMTKNTTETNGQYKSTGKDENAILVTKGKTILNNANVTRKNSKSTGGDTSSFYGVGSAILNKGGKLYVNGGTIATDAAGAAGIFSYNKGVIYAQGSTINTKQDTSGGIHVAGGGKLYAWGLNVTTNGESSAAIRSDRGGGTMVVDGGTYTSNGIGSPAIYSTADITVNNATLNATNSEAICLEGKNTIRLFNSNLKGNMPDNEQNDNTWTAIVYQSMSGDSQEGNGTFEMVGGTLTSGNGGIFYTTNTDSTFILSDVKINYSDDCDYFLRATGNSNKRGWGQTGKNGANCKFTASKQEMKGKVVYDSISNLNFYMKDGSKLTGSFVDDETNAGTGGDGKCNVYISSDSTWVVTDNSKVTNLYSEGKIVDSEGKIVTIKGEDGTVYVKGDSKYVVTVKTYSAKADFSGASKVDKYSDYKVAKPSEFTTDILSNSKDKTVATSSQSTKRNIGIIVSAVVFAGVIWGVVLYLLKKKKR